MSRLTQEREAEARRWVKVWREQQIKVSHGLPVESDVDLSDYTEDAFDEIDALRVELAEAKAERGRLAQRDSCLLADVADAIGIVRKSDGAPRVLNWTQALAEMRELRESRDESDGDVDRLEDQLANHKLTITINAENLRQQMAQRDVLSKELAEANARVAELEPLLSTAVDCLRGLFVARRLGSGAFPVHLDKVEKLFLELANAEAAQKGT